MRVIHRRWFSVASLLILWSLASRAKAQLLPFPIPVLDASRVAQLVEQLRQMAQLYSQLSTGLNALENAAKRLGGGRLVDDILLGHYSLAGDLQTIGYHLETVNRQFERVFPTEEAVRNTRPSDVAELSRGWDREIDQSSLAAARAQTTLSTIETNTRSVQAILERSQRAEQGDQGSQLAKLQALVQMIGVLNSDIGTLAATLATTERVNAALAGSEVSEARITAERRRRLLRGHGRRSRAPGGLDRRFLQER